MEREPTSGQDGARPSISVLMPFAGDAEAARRALSALERLALGPDDEVIVADNSIEPEVVRMATEHPKLRVVRAGGERSSYHARNVAAEAARSEWLLFIDSDCRPPADLLDRYFNRPPPAACGLMAGGVEGAAEQTSVVARWFHSRSALKSEVLSTAYEKPIGVTANLLVRRRAWEAVGGFQEGIRSHGDGEFCWRVQDAGWTLAHLPAAAVEHFHRETVADLARVSARYGAGAAWLNRHRPGSCPRPRPISGLARSAVGASWFALTARLERARFKLLDGVSILANAIGYLLSNRPPAIPVAAPSGPDAHPATAIVCDSFPVLAETFIAQEARTLMAEGMPVRIEAVMRPERPNRAAADGLSVGYIEDEGALRRLSSGLVVGFRHPVRTVRDVVTRRQWPAAERVPLVSLTPMVRRLEAWGAGHVHAHFATTASVTAARIAGLLGVPHSVTAHAHEIFVEPKKLQEKLSAAAFVTTGCEYNRAFLRDRVLANSGPPVHEIVMGVDPERFKRSTPQPEGRTVVAVGRLVAKKGFADLIEAAALLEQRGEPLDQLLIAGEGPMRGQLERLLDERALRGRGSLLGALNPVQVRALLERAAVLAMPCVVAENGDRDSMPVVVKEALAMEVPVVATAEVGLPELVRPEFGRLVPPNEPEALADAISAVLALDTGERAQMGAQGRAWVTEHANVTRETRKLADLIGSAARD